MQNILTQVHKPESGAEGGERDRDVDRRTNPRGTRGKQIHNPEGLREEGVVDRYILNYEKAYSVGLWCPIS